MHVGLKSVCNSVGVADKALPLKEGFGTGAWLVNGAGGGDCGGLMRNEFKFKYINSFCYEKWIWIGVVAVVAIFFYATYNGFVNREEGLKSAWSNVETQYQRRADLIPNLVNTVRATRPTRRRP